MVQGGTMNMTEKIVKVQLLAMGSEYFDLGIRSEIEDNMIIKIKLSKEEIIKSIGWLKFMNCRKNHIYIRPSGNHSLCLLDDLNIETIQRMKSDGYSPAAIIETSPTNYQVWLKHEIILDKLISTKINKKLCKMFNADIGSVDYHHFGRLAGFTNPKSKYQNERGLSPFSKLQEASGNIFEKSRMLIAEEIKTESVNPANREAVFRYRKSSNLTTITAFHRHPKYGGDLHRADLAWATYAINNGATDEEVFNTLLDCRDLTNKGNQQRQLAYVERTVRKAQSPLKAKNSKNRNPHPLPLRGGEEKDQY